MTRRTLLIGAGAGALSVLLVSCTPEPQPSPRPTRPPSPTPLPTGSVATPTAVVRSSWSTDPFARGAASFTPVGVQSNVREALAVPVGGRVFFAGEATDAASPGTLRGAVDSGVRAANDVLRLAADGERIAIIGAGLAGATAASRLANSGAEVTVFEARDRLGGRIHTQNSDEWPLGVQLGGWLFSPADAELAARLGVLDIAAVDLTASGWRSADGEVDPVGDETIQEAIEAAQALPADVSLAEALTGTGVDPEDPAVGALLAYLAATSGADADEISSWFPPTLPASEYTAAVGDLGPLVERLLENARVTLSSPVSHVVYDDTGVSLRLGTGESLSFDRVVLTVPLGVLQQNGLEFDPPLPFSHRGAIATLAMGQIETVWLRFDEPYGESDASIWHIVGGETTIRTWVNLYPATGESVMVGIVGGAAAVEFAALGDREAAAAALASLEMFVQPAGES